MAFVKHQWCQWGTGEREPCVEQPSVNGWDMSWNPDDNMYYICHPTTGDCMTRRSLWRNAVQWARNVSPAPVQLHLVTTD